MCIYLSINSIYLSILSALHHRRDGVKGTSEDEEMDEADSDTDIGQSNSIR